MWLLRKMVPHHHVRLDFVQNIHRQGKTMTPTEIAEIEARLAAATPGEWPVDVGYLIVESDGRCYAKGPSYSTQGYDECGKPIMHAQAIADARFTAHARADIAALLAENARLREEVARMSKPINVFVQANTDGASVVVDPKTGSAKIYFRVGIPREALEASRDVDGSAFVRVKVQP